MDKEYIDYEEVVNDNIEDANDINQFDPAEIVVYSRDWTIETIYNQIKLNNIDLNPKFQRRNAWNDEKRSKLIESIIMGYPIPEIVLAEDPKRKKSFIVIDGKQRLLTIAGYIDNQTYNYWDRPKLRKLSVRTDLNNIDYTQLQSNDGLNEELREFSNASLRCTVITNFTQTDVLYDIFYRLNSGSVALSTQELRQVLNRGAFADYLINITNTTQPIHQVLGLENPDKRLKDIEIILRIISFILFPTDYRGNLRTFLDNKMQLITQEWDKMQIKISQIYDDVNDTINYLSSIFGGYQNIGRKATDNNFENRFNKVIFEVELFYFLQIDKSQIKNPEKFIEGFKKLCTSDNDFRSSVESSTKNIENYRIRYTKFEKLINDSLGLEIHINPFI